MYFLDLLIYGLIINKSNYSIQCKFLITMMTSICVIDHN